MRLVECVPNFSEGRRRDVIAAIRAVAETVSGVYVLDEHTDPIHNRLVLTFAGEVAGVAEAAFRCTERAAQLIDLDVHRGEHPRIGATDVVPFVPLGDTTLADCTELAKQVGQRIGDELHIPVYLYAEAATRPERRWLPHLRRGGYEALKDEIGRVPARAPDFGPASVGPAGATAVGARQPLIAFNVNLATGDLELARQIARAIRESGGGLPAVQARGMPTASASVVQVSMNLLDYTRTSPARVYDLIEQLAGARGVAIAASEIVGLLPVGALTDLAQRELRAADLGPERVLENRLLVELLRRLG